jgi:hypothetical protein
MAAFLFRERSKTEVDSLEQSGCRGHRSRPGAEPTLAL